MTDTDFHLYLGGKESKNLHLQLSGLPEDVIALCVVQCTWSTIEKLWFVEQLDLETKEWTAENTVDSSVRIYSASLMIFGLKRIDNGQSGRWFQVVTAGTAYSSLWNMGPLHVRLDREPSSSATSLSTRVISCLTEKELKLERDFKLPDNYTVQLSGDNISDERDVLLFIEHGNKTEYIIWTKAGDCRIHIPKPVISRQTYTCVVIELADQENSNYSCLRVGQQNVHTVMTKDELEIMKAKAEAYERKKSLGRQEVKIMFRNKPKKIFDAIMDDNNGLMETYIKDNNGDRYSPINSNINGLFFSVSLDSSGILPDFSYFGDRRLHIPVGALFTDDTNLYYTDFYCHGRAHYVTVVLTRQGSETDKFCQETLLLLDQNDNPFFYKEGDAVYTSNCQRQLHVEVFYTEDVDIKDLQRRYNTTDHEEVYFRSTSTRGAGKSTPGGIEKRRSCRVCQFDETN